MAEREIAFPGNAASPAPAETPRWRGIIPPLVTPLTSDGQLDFDALERLLAHVLAGGVHGLFILGTTGEAPHLSQRLRCQLISETCRIAHSRTRIMVGISDTSLEDAAALGRLAADAGADALVSTAPYYFQLEETELVEHMRRLAADVPLPMFLYNMPQMSKSRFTVNILRRLMDVRQIAGLKDSGGDFEQFCEFLSVCRERPDWSVLIGPENLLCDALAAGADGGISGGANICPRWFVELYEASQLNDADRIQACQRQVARLGRLYQIVGSSTASIQGIKAALAALGLCQDAMAAPFHIGEDVKREAAQIVKECILSQPGSGG